MSPLADSSDWQPARLIPTSGINGADEAERRATSALLAVLAAVSEFREAMLKPLGAPAGRLECFIEVPFELDDGERVVSPDGLLHASRGKRSWTTLVEVKTGDGRLTEEQVTDYVDVARANSFDGVLTISNEMHPAPGVHPVVVDRRKTRRVALHHISWAEVLTHAMQTRIHRGVSDPDQAWILGELIRYLEHPRSGALDFCDMGAHWVGVRDQVKAGTLRMGDRGLSDVASRWDQLLRFTALRLGRELGADVQCVVPRADASDPSARIDRHASGLVSDGQLTGTLRVPGAAAPIVVVADLRAEHLTASAELSAPASGRETTKVNWITRQLRDAAIPLRVDGLLQNSRASTSALLSDASANPQLVVDSSGRAIRAFRVASVTRMGVKRGTGRGSFIDSVVGGVDDFYRQVLENVTPWAPRAPRMPTEGRSAAEEAGLVTEPPQSDMAPAVVADPFAEWVSRTNSADGGVA